MIILDLCCGAGGATAGYVAAGHIVFGIDIAEQPNYLKSGAAGFLQMDALEALSQPWIRNVDPETMRDGYKGYQGLLMNSDRMTAGWAAWESK